MFVTWNDKKIVLFVLCVFLLLVGNLFLIFLPKSVVFF